MLYQFFVPSNLRQNALNVTMVTKNKHCIKVIILFYTDVASNLCLCLLSRKLLHSISRKRQNHSTSRKQPAASIIITPKNLLTLPYKPINYQNVPLAAPSSYHISCKILNKIEPLYTQVYRRKRVNRRVYSVEWKFQISESFKSFTFESSVRFFSLHRSSDNEKKLKAPLVLYLCLFCIRVFIFFLSPNNRIFYRNLSPRKRVFFLKNFFHVLSTGRGGVISMG